MNFFFRGHTKDKFGHITCEKMVVNFDGTINSKAWARETSCNHSDGT